MKERPILFSAPMVRALLAGTKTQTRRMVKQRNADANTPGKHHPIEPYTNGRGSWNFVLSNHGHGTGDPFACPYGVPGDRLWVREAWAQNWNQLSDDRMDRSYVYRADGGSRAQDNGTDLPWRPSIHMPRAASRLTLEITDVRIERLQAISDDDLEREGLQEIIDAGVDHDGWPRDAWRALWSSINGAASWHANPWVWCVAFRRV